MSSSRLKKRADANLTSKQFIERYQPKAARVRENRSKLRLEMRRRKQRWYIIKLPFNRNKYNALFGSMRQATQNFLPYLVTNRPFFFTFLFFSFYLSFFFFFFSFQLPLDTRSSSWGVPPVAPAVQSAPTADAGEAALLRVQSAQPSALLPLHLPGCSAGKESA